MTDTVVVEKEFFAGTKFRHPLGDRHIIIVDFENGNCLVHTKRLVNKKTREIIETKTKYTKETFIMLIDILVIYSNRTALKEQE